MSWKQGNAKPTPVFVPRLYPRTDPCVAIEKRLYDVAYRSPFRATGPRPIQLFRPLMPKDRKCGVALWVGVDDQNALVIVNAKCALTFDNSVVLPTPPLLLENTIVFPTQNPLTSDRPPATHRNLA